MRQIAKKIGSEKGGTFLRSTHRVYREKKLKKWKLEDIGEKIGPRQLCRGMTISQFDMMVNINDLTQDKPKKIDYDDLEHSDIGRQVIRGGDPNLLSLTPCLETANLYGANRFWLPRDGVIIIGAYPAVFTNISKQAKFCPQLCEKEQKIAVERILQSGDYYRDPPDVVNLTIECNEICAVVGKQKGIHFDGMYDPNKFIHTVHHVIGTGRPKLGLVPISSCLVESFTNPDYIERAFSVEIVLTKNPEHLEILEDTMRLDGKLEPGQRVLTPDDAALIMGDPALRMLAVAAAGSSGTIIVSSVPKGVHGPNLVDYMKSLFKEELLLQRETINKLKM